MNIRINKKIIACMFAIIVLIFAFSAKPKAATGKYSIAFNKNGGKKGTMDPMTGIGFTEERQLTANKFTRDGYVFRGWSMTAGGGVSYYDKAKVKGLSKTNGATVTLYAVWGKILTSQTELMSDRNIGSRIQLSREGNQGGDVTSLAENQYNYCFEHEAWCVGGTYSVQSYFEIEGNKATYYSNNSVTTGTEVFDNSNLALGYILANGNLAKGWSNNGRITLRQRALWYYGDTWMSNAGNKFLKQTWNIKGNKGIDDFNDETYKYTDLVDDAEKYANKGAINTNVSFASGSVTSYVDTRNTILGPFKLNFDDERVSITSINVIDTSNKAITSGVTFYSDAKAKNRINSNSIGKNQAFYIKNTNNTEIKSIKVNVKTEAIYTLKLWILYDNNKANQRLLVVKPGSKEKTDSTELSIGVITGSIQIHKKDKYSGSTLSGAGYKIYMDGNGNGWLVGKKAPYTYTNNVSSATEYLMDASQYSSTDTVQFTTFSGTNANYIGKKVLKIEGLRIGDYHIYETTAPSGNYDTTPATSKYDIKVQPGYDSSKGYVDTGKVGKVGELSSSGTRTLNRLIDIENIPKGSIYIYKKDGDTGAALEGAGFKIYKDGSGWLKGTTIPYTYVSDVKNATEYTMDNNNKTNYVKYMKYDANNNNYKNKMILKIDGLTEGSYKIYETTAPKGGYNLQSQSGYDKQNGYVDLNIVAIVGQDSGNNSRIWNRLVDISNGKKVSITGRVWEEQPSSKEDIYGYDNIYSSTLDKNLEGITVKLIKKGTTSATATTTTNANGIYRFDNVIKQSELDSYYVLFDYSSKNQGNLRYIPVTFNKQNKTNGSKALTSTIPTEDIQVGGVATTYAESDETATSTYGLNAVGSYNESTATLSDINLGIKPLIAPKYLIKESLAEISLKIKGYEYKYIYNGKSQELKLEGPLVRVQKTTTKTGYNRAIYPSDIIYDKQSSKQELQAIVTYRIDVQNDCKINKPELYQQADKLVITSMVDEFDTSRYTLVEDDTWKLENNKAVMKDLTKINGENGGIDSTKTETAFIKFNVKKEAINKILENPDGIMEDYPTKVISKAHHEYHRDGYMWENLTKTGPNINGLKVIDKLHKTIEIEDDSEAPYLVFNLNQERTISGTVFKDEIVSNNGEILGNGLYDNGEKGIKGVKVELLDIGGESPTLSHLYQAEKNSENKVTTKIVNAIAETNEKGEYKLNGVVPGRYYLRFTYGNGAYIIITDLDGKKVVEKSINAKDYKSTIVLDFIKNVFNINEDGHTEKELIEKIYTWYKNADKEYSVALDNLDRRKAINTSNENTNMNMDAMSPQISITIENTKENQMQEDKSETDKSKTVANTKETVTLDNIINDEAKQSKHYLFDKFNFGLIEMPRQKAVIEKLITNVKLTKSQAVLYNGNPEDSSVQGVVAVTDLDLFTNGGSSNVRAEVEEASLYGSELELTYQVKVTNVSDINYYNEDYYKFGDSKGGAKEVTLTPTLVLDYLDESLDYKPDDSDKDRIEEIAPNTKETIKVDGEDIKVNALKLKGGPNSDNWKTLYTKRKKDRDNKYPTEDSVKIVATRKLPEENENKDMEIVSRAEIKSIKTTPDPNDINPEKEEQIKIAAKEVHTNGMVKATISLSTPTGEDRSFITMYAIAGIIALIVLSTGIVVIKKRII